MANPFATFRKNQKVWMAGLVLLAILAFVIAPVFDYAMSAVRGGGGTGQVVVRWDGGQITQADLLLSTQKHSEVVRFLQMAAEKVIERGGIPAVPNFQYNPQTRQILGIGIQYSSDPIDVCRTRFLEAKAQKLGVAFDDEAVDQFLLSYCNSKLSDAEVNELMAKASGGTLSAYEVREVLKTELSAYVVARASMTGLFAENRNSLTPISTPGKAYFDFAKLNRTAKVEAFPIMVDDYLDKVTGEPSEAEVQEIYDQGMTQVASADSPEPGFARLYRANIEYIEGSLQKWTEAEKANVTEEEIKAEYDRRVELGQLKVPVEPEPEAGSQAEGAEGGESAEATTDSDGEAASDDGKPEEGMPESGTTETEAPAETNESAPAEEPAATEEPAASEEKKSDGPTSEESVSEEPASTEPKEEPTSEEPEGTGDGDAKPESGDQSRVPSNNSVRLVSMTQDQTEEEPQTDEPQNEDPQTEDPQTEEPASETPAEEAPETPSTETPAQEEPQAETTSEPEPTQQDDEAPKPETQEDAPATGTEEAGETTGETDTQTGDAGESGEGAAEEPAEPAEPEMRTQTLEEARDTIVESLARERAIPALNKAMETMIKDHMRPYYGKFRQYQAQLDAGMKDLEAPVRPNIKKLAEELNLIYRETGMLDGSSVAQTPIGQSNLQAGTSGVSGSVANNLMVPNRVDLNAPLEASYFDQQALMRGEMPEFLRFLLWKTEEQLPYVPELDEVREEVVDAWRRQKARVLAEAAAKELSGKVGGENPWEGALSETEKALVIETNNFTWMNRMGDFIIPTPVPKLDRVGNQFMQSVFKVPAGEIVVAPNSSKSVYYVTRVVSFDPSEEDLQSRFNADPIKAGVNRIVMEERNLHRAAWYEQLENELGVEWQVAFDQLY